MPAAPHIPGASPLPQNGSTASQSTPPPPPTAPPAPPSPTPSPAATAPAAPTPVTDEELRHSLSGTYTPLPAPLSDVVSSNLDRPLHIRSIRLSPAPPTSRPAFLSALIKPFLQPLPDWVPRWLDPAPSSRRGEREGGPKTLQEVLQTTRTLMAHLDKFGVYDTQRSTVRMQPVRGGDVDEVELVLGLKERGRLFLKAGTEVGGGEGGGVSGSHFALDGWVCTVQAESKGQCRPGSDPSGRVAGIPSQ